MRALPLAACLLFALPCWAESDAASSVSPPSPAPATGAGISNPPSIAAAVNAVGHRFASAGHHVANVGHRLAGVGRDFAGARATDLQTLVLGPPAAESAPLQPSSCEALYRQRVALIHQQTDARPAWAEDPRNQVATAFGFVSSISFAYLPFTAVQHYLSDSRKAGLEARIDQLRQASASQMCYQR